MSKIKCNHPHCNHFIDYDRYACLKHWTLLPKDIRSRIVYGMQTSSARAWLRANDDAHKFWLWLSEQKKIVESRNADQRT